MSVARERRFRAQQARELARDLRKKERARLLELRRELKLARSAKLERVRELRTLCRAERARLREKRKRLLAELGETRRELRARSSSCSSELVGARELGGKTVAAARSAYELERDEQRKTRAIRRAWEGETSSKPLSTGRERRADSDDEVRGNIPPELVPVFNKVREKMRGTDYMSRTEAFLEWVHNNSATVERMLNESHHEDVAALEREERELARNVKSAARYSPKRKIAALAADLGVAVPSSSSKSHPKPKRARFQILTRDGSEKYVAGYILGDFGTAAGAYSTWTITHLPTGYALAFGPLTKATALAKLQALELDPSRELEGYQRKILHEAPTLREALAVARSAGDVPF